MMAKVVAIADKLQISSLLEACARGCSEMCREVRLLLWCCSGAAAPPAPPTRAAGAARAASVADLLPLSQALLTNQAVVTNYDPTYGDVFTGT